MTPEPSAKNVVASIITQLQQAIAGLTYMSETDAPLEVVQWAPIPEGLKAQLRPPIQTVPLEQFFRSQTQEQDWYSDDERDRAKRFQALVDLLKQHLQDIQVFKVGDVEKTAYVLGRAPDGSTIGLKTTVVET